MDAITPACRTCGKPLQEPRKLKDFCSYSCRGQYAVNTLSGPTYQTGLSGAKSPRRNKSLRSLKQRSVGAFTFSKINSATYRIDPASKRGAGWLMEVAWPGGVRQRWVARVGNRASEPLPLDGARRAEVLREKRSKAEPRD